MTVSANPIEREVRTYLRDHYGVREATLSQGGGGHPRLTFEHGGKRRVLTLPNPGMDRGLAAQLKFQDIRRLLGPPTDAPTPREKRRLEDMMPEPIAMAAKPLGTPGEAARVMPAETEPQPRAYRGTCSLTISPSSPGNTRFRICIPDDLYRAFGHRGPVEFRVLGDDTIQVSAHPDRGRKTPCFNRSGRLWMTIKEKLFPVDALLFGSSPSEMILVDGSIVARIIEKHPVRERAEPPVDAGSKPAAPTIEQKVTKTIGHMTGDPASEMRDLLRRITAVEAASPYRLLRLEGHGWAWRAPTIRLTEEGAMILGLTGARAGFTEPQLRAVRGAVAILPDRIVHGGAVGVDEALDRWFRLLGLPSDRIEVYPASGERARVAANRGGIVHPVMSPLYRNRLIAKRCDWLLACPSTQVEGLRSGTWATVRYARAAGKPIALVLPDGTIKEEER